MSFSNYYAFVALQIANERAAEARAHRLAELAHPAPSHGGVRRSIARIALAVARAADEHSIEGATPATC